MTAAELLIEARNSVVEPAPGEVLIIKSREYHRGSGSVEQLTPEGLVSVPVPNETITTTWLLIGDTPGKIAMKHLVQRDLAGNVVQEEFYDGEVDYVYFALLKRMMVVPQDDKNLDAWTFSLSADVDAILAERVNEAVYRGETLINGRNSHLIEVRRRATAADRAADGGGYRGIDASDLDVREFVTRFAFDVDDLSLVRRETVAVDVRGIETRLNSRTVDNVSISAIATLPEDTFSLQFVPQDILERDG